MKPAAEQPVVHDPLAAVPLIAPGVEARVDEHGLVQLKQKRVLGKGFFGGLADRMGLAPDRKIHLDERASRFWSMIDGQRPLHEIADAVAAELAVPPADARALCVSFTRDLMVRDLILLRITPPAAHKP